MASNHRPRFLKITFAPRTELFIHSVCWDKRELKKNIGSLCRYVNTQSLCFFLGRYPNSSDKFKRECWPGLAISTPLPPVVASQRNGTMSYSPSNLSCKLLS